MKPHIAIVGRMNAGKSTLLNFLTAQQASIVAPQAGTTTDPVRRSFYLLDYGAVIFIDTAGFDDTSAIGAQRVKSTRAAIAESDLVLFVPMVDGRIDAQERAFLETIDASKPRIVVNKPFSDTLLDQIKTKLQNEIGTEPDFFGGRISADDTVVLVCPIDSEAPRGKLIMPQVAAVRAALDLHARAMVVQPAELDATLKIISPRLVVVDSQAYTSVAQIVGTRSELTTFSILLAEQKGDMKAYRQGLGAIAGLDDGDRILLVEHCSHQTSCEDIARVKIPQYLFELTDRNLQFTVINGRSSLPEDLACYSLVVQCGGCVATSAAIRARIEQCCSAGVPITNYGMLLSASKK
ncbi:MAG: GTPase [Mucinivorans sp.]